MSFSLNRIQALAFENFGLEVTVKALPGEIDLNFLLETSSGGKFNLKIANPETGIAYLEFQNALMRRLEAAQLGLAIPQVIASKTGSYITPVEPSGYMRLLSWVEGRCFADVNPHTPALLKMVGAMVGKLSKALDGFDHPAAHRFIKWDPSEVEWTAPHIGAIENPDKQAIVQYFLQLFQEKAALLASKLRKSVCYNDANDYNILVSFDPENPTVPGVIDFGDAVFTHTINDLAIACAYAAMHKPDPLTTIFQVAQGYCKEFPLTEPECSALFAHIGARLVISVTCSALNRAENPDNAYLQISDGPAWALLEKLRRIQPELVHAVVRHANGLEPCPKRAAYDAWLNAQMGQIAPIVKSDWSAAVWLDLRVGSPQLGNYADIQDAERLHQQILSHHTGRMGLGRYNEMRAFYTTDAYAVAGNNGPEWRSVHIGLDVFLPPGTPVCAPIKGVIHSFQDNAHDRDYGPAIILEHKISDSFTFYTLYGHLTRTSLHNLAIGKTVEAGEDFCAIGPMPENGNWSPHLHFQVILDLLGNSGDYPGVAFPRWQAVWTSLCPDPWQLLTGKPSPPPEPYLSTEEIVAFRRRHLGKNLSVSYQNPLNIRRGWRQYLFDLSGRRYLDTVNNVAHVGHEHPRVVEAGQRQMAVLNTNTRYLHDHIIRFGEAIITTFPPELSVAFFVNSGSEANELALRLAKNYTGQKDMIAVEVGYHGNTQGCVDISSYKFSGPGGKGAPPFTHVVPIPDTYRGLFRGHTPENGLKYAAFVGEAIQKVRGQGRDIAAFICESVISCGGQVTLPPGYLSESARQVRAAGGVYIADEVQTGCGRHGEHFWAFQEHGVVPDIVTVGKPIGNGHPLGVVVTTPAVADAFANGMEYFNTFGGNPVSCVIGLEVLRVIEAEGLQANAREMGLMLTSELRNLAARFPVIGDVRGPGLFLGFELIDNPLTLAPSEAKATYLANRMRELGVLMSTDGPFHNVLKIKPPIVFGKSDADFLLDMLERVLREDAMQL